MKKRFIREEYTNALHLGFYLETVLPQLRKDEERMRKVSGEKYHYYYDVRETDEFEAADSSWKHREDPVVLVSVYAWCEIEAQ